MALIAAKVLDSTHLELAAPIETAQGEVVMVSVVGLVELDDEREGWYALCAESLAAAYGDDEPEYTLDMVKEPNPAFQA